MQKRVKWITIAALFALPRLAGAAPCSGLPNPIYVSGSSAVQPFIQQMSAVVAAGSTPATLVYKNAGSCTGVQAIVNDTTPTGTCAAGACITGTATYFTGTGGMTSNSCDLDVNGTHVDVGVSDVFGTFCQNGALPSGVADIQGPAQAMVFVVPKASTQTALVAEEGYFVFGFPNGDGMAMPWMNDLFKFIRNATSGTQGILASSLGVPTAKVHGTDGMSNGMVLTDVTGSTSAESTIGFLAAAFYDAHRDTVTQLAFKAYKQYYAYYADSSPTSFDKKNVRDGHYLPFGYVHMIVHTDSSGNPTSANAANFVKWVLGQQVLPGTSPPDILDVTISAHVIPLCAMHVSRTAEGGDLSHYSDPAPCDCYFEFKATGMSPTTATRCAACSGSTPCSGTQQCRHNYCEPR